MRDYIQVNLLPIEYRVVRKDYSFLLDWRPLTGTVIVIAACLAFVAGRQFIEANLATKKSALTQVQAEIAQNNFVEQKIRELEKIRDEKNAKNTSLKSISVNKRKWIGVLEGLSKSLPLNTWLESIKQSGADEEGLEIDGKTFVFPEVAEYMMELEKLDCFQQVSLASIEFKHDADQSYFSFTLKIEMNPNSGMPVEANGAVKGKVL